VHSKGKSIFLGLFVTSLFLASCTKQDTQNRAIAIDTITRTISGAPESDSLQLDTTCYSNDVAKFGDPEIPPRCINLGSVRRYMVYPDSAKNEKVEGRVFVKLLIDTCGFVSEIGKMQGPDIFYDEVRRICPYLRFTPGVYYNTLVKVWVTLPFRFKLTN